MASRKSRPQTKIANIATNRMHGHKRMQSGSALPPAKTLVSTPHDKSNDHPREGSTICSATRGQIATLSSSLKTAQVMENSPRIIYKQSPTEQVPSPSSSGRGNFLPSPTARVEYSLPPEVPSCLSPLAGLENRPIPIPNPDARATITNPLRTQSKKSGDKRKDRQWHEAQVQSQEFITPISQVVGSRSIHKYGHTDMTRLVFATSRLVERYMWKKRPFMNAMDLEMVGYKPRRILKVFVNDLQIIEKRWTTAMQQKDIWSIAFEARSKDILKEVCRASASVRCTY